MSSSQGQSYYKVSTAFERSLEAPLLPGLATTGRFLLPSADPKKSLSAAKSPALAPCLAAASTGQTVVIHNNNTNTAAAKKSAKRGRTDAAGGSQVGVVGDEAALRRFSFGKEPTALAAGRLPLREQEALLYGAAASLLAYDVDQNRQFFYKDIEDGVRAVTSGPIRTTADSGADNNNNNNNNNTAAAVLTLVGGNCSVYGFDSDGQERFWTVTGDQVTAMMMLPWGGDKGHRAEDPPALVAASEDFEIRVFNGEVAVASIMEVDCVRQLVPHHHHHPGANNAAPSAGEEGRFAYLLNNGTVGVYQRTERLWRIKSKCLPVSAAFCDVDRDGVAELVVGYDNGRVEIRSDLRAGSGNRGGEVLFRDTYGAPVVAVLAEDYRQDGRVLPLVCTADGNVRGLTLLESTLDDAEETRDAQALETLTQQRALLASQLASLEEQLALQERGEQDLTMPEAGLEVQASVRANFATQKLDLVLTLANAPRDAVIHSCLLRATAAAAFFGAGTEEEGGGDIRCYYADDPSDTLVCPVAFERDIGTDLTASVAVGSAFAESYQVHDVPLTVPPFAAYQLASVAQSQYPLAALSYHTPSGFVRLTFDRALNMKAIEAWMRRSFSIPPELSLADASDPAAPVLRVEVISMRGGASLAVEARSVSPTAAGGGGVSTITVKGDSMDSCGDVVTSLDGLPGGVVEGGDAAPTATRCEFPEELQHLQNVLTTVDDLNAIREKLSTDMADAAAVVKTLLIRAEDARLLGDMTAMRKGYAALYDVDKELLGENMKRANNYEELKKALKDVNRFIQKVGRLRLGAAQRSAVVTACRNALKSNKTTALMDVARTGSVS